MFAQNYKNSGRNQCDSRLKRTDEIAELRREQRAAAAQKMRDAQHSPASLAVLSSVEATIEHNNKEYIRNNGKNADELRLKRAEITVELRKKKRGEAILEIRNISTSSDSNNQHLLEVLRESRDKIPSIANAIFVLPDIAEGLSLTNQPIIQLEATLTLASLASSVLESTCQLIQMVFDTGIIPKLIPLLSHSDIKIQRAASSALKNIMDESIVITHEHLTPFSDLLSHSDSKIRLQAAQFLQNLVTGDQIKLQLQTIFQADLLPILIENFKNGTVSMQKVTLALINFFTINGNKNDILKLVNEGVLPPLCNMLSHKDVGVIDNALTSIDNILKWTAGRQTADIAHVIEECGGSDELDKLANHKNRKISNLADHIISEYLLENIF